LIGGAHFIARRAKKGSIKMAFIIASIPSKIKDFFPKWNGSPPAPNYFSEKLLPPANTRESRPTKPEGAPPLGPKRRRKD